MTLLFKQMMETGGFSVDVFNDSAGALRDFKPHFYDLVMLDLVMPKMDGFDLYKELKKQDPDVNVCFITASGQHHEDLRKEEYRNLDKVLFLYKPMNMKTLLAEINKRIK
jgi:two-component system, OmpR family, response regulator ChvI